MDYLNHIDHAIKVAGIDHVGIGSDREHRVIRDTPEEKEKLIKELSRLRPVTASTFRWPFFIAELNHPRRMETIATALERRGYKSAEIDRILGGNFYRLFKETIGRAQGYFDSSFPFRVHPSDATVTVASMKKFQRT